MLKHQLGEIPHVIEKARDLILAYMGAHEATCSDPDCIAGPNVIAFLAHALGLDKDEMNKAHELKDDYDVACPNCTERN